MEVEFVWQSLCKWAGQSLDSHIGTTTTHNKPANELKDTSIKQWRQQCAAQLKAHDDSKMTTTLAALSRDVTEHEKQILSARLALQPQYPSVLDSQQGAHSKADATLAAQE